jgi:ATP-dependent DNA ligase
MMQILYPPRPKGRIPPTELSRLEQTGKWIVQRKFNGDRNLIHISVAGKISFFSRYGKVHERWKPSDTLIQQVASLNLRKDEEYWLDGELLHLRAKVDGIQDTVVLYDVLQAGKYLFGVNQMARLSILKDICRYPNQFVDRKLALKITDSLWLAEFWESDFLQHFNESKDSEVLEGLVLKKKNSSLDNAGNKPYDVDWQIRCRKSSGNYGF